MITLEKIKSYKKVYRELDLERNIPLFTKIIPNKKKENEINMCRKFKKEQNEI